MMNTYKGSEENAREQPCALKAQTLLVEGNRRFVTGSFKPKNTDEEKRKMLLDQGQTPYAVIVGCSDSRVPPEIIFDGDLGDFFVIRSAGNIVDTITLGSIEYAVEHLDVPLVVILGHESCGAVKTAVLALKANVRLTPAITAIVEKIKPSVVKAAKQARAGEEQLYSLVELAVDENIKAVKEELLSSSSVVDRYVQEARVVVLEAKYFLESGEVSFK